TIDPLSEITRFSLEKKIGSSGTFNEIAQPLSVNGSVTLTDDKADIKLQNFYRLSAINNCNNPVQVSNLSSNLVLLLNRNGNDLTLSWNSYKDWMGIISSYRLFINTGKGFEEKVVLPPTDTIFTLGYKDIMYEVSGNEVCFYISASETSNPHGITGQSHSSGICTVPAEVITVPNIFTPNSGTVNSLFKPVLSFTPFDYLLVITDKQGKVLFESRDYSKTWDGTQNGKALSQGVYLWFLKVTTPSGKSISKTGTVTTVNNR
ncbi:MAG: T9SS type B sorting domain-containing protein, partial [Bacteroidetes bacterium]